MAERPRYLAQNRGSRQKLSYENFKINPVNGYPPTKAFSSPPPAADFRMPQVIRAGAAAQFECASKPASGEIVERLWDFNHGIAEVTANPQHTFEQPGKYRVT